MKSILSIVLLILSNQLSAQSENDTTTILYNGKWEVITEGIPVFVGLVWKDGGKWHSQDFYYSSAQLQMDGTYADKQLSVKYGSFSWFYENGLIKDSCQYVNSKKDGSQATWDEEGNQTSVQHWHNDLPVDTAVWWGKNGRVDAVQITDSSGNGFYQEYLQDGKVVLAKGLIYQGKRNGKWSFKDVNGILAMEAMYNADSITSVACFDEKGELENDNKNCLLGKSGGFKGGSDSWARYFERNMHYPEAAQRLGIQGTVKVSFIVEKDGSISNIKLLSAPHESLGKEALRIIKLSPKWEPATRYNRPVIYHHFQTITFRLQ